MVRVTLFLNLLLFPMSVAMSLKKSCAVIGGGVAGLSCANQLADNFEVTVFDTGRLRPGGRSSSRLPGDLPKEGDDAVFHQLSKCVIDHAAQVVQVPHSKNFKPFKAQIEKWAKEGVLTPFEHDTLFYIEKAEDGFNLKPFSEPAFYGSKDMGMAAVPHRLVDSSAGRFTLRQDVWVSPSSGARYMPKTKNWRISASGQVLGYFDHLVISHNGKCADRLMSRTPVKDIHKLLRVNFSPTVAAHGGKRMTLSSIYSFSFALPRDSALSRVLPGTYKAGFINNENMLRFLSCQTRKYPSNDDDVEVWTLLSSSNFAKKHKAPQEFLPEETVKEVTDLMLRAVERSLDISNGSIRPIEQRLQLWGAALPLNTWENRKGYIYDSQYKVGVCGDWLAEASLGGAWMSGYNLGLSLSKGLAKDVGLDGEFVRSLSAAKNGLIGQTPVQS